MAIRNLVKQSFEGSWVAVFNAVNERGTPGEWYFAGDIVHAHIQTPNHLENIAAAAVVAGIAELAGGMVALAVALNWAITANSDGSRDWYVIDGVRFVKRRILWWKRWQPTPIKFQGFVPSTHSPPTRTDYLRPGVIVPATPWAIYKIHEVRTVANLFRNKP